MITSGPDEIDTGYFELRVNWTAKELMEMTPAQFARLKELEQGFRELAREVEPNIVEVRP